jgi:hypothetical protein
MNFIKHIIEPTKLFMTWQLSNFSSFSAGESRTAEPLGINMSKNRRHYIVAELVRIGENIRLSYLVDQDDFRLACELGFNGYPAFPATDVCHETGVLDAFMRRLPPRKRGDFSTYLEGFRLKPDTQLSDFALLGYTGAKLPSDGFAIVHPFDKVEDGCELLIEATGYRDQVLPENSIKIDAPASFEITQETHRNRLEEVIKIFVREQHIGYVTRVLLPTFQDWLKSERIAGAWIEKKNGTPEKPVVYLFVQTSPLSVVKV